MINLLGLVHIPNLISFNLSFAQLYVVLFSVFPFIAYIQLGNHISRYRQSFTDQLVQSGIVQLSAVSYWAAQKGMFYFENIDLALKIVFFCRLLNIDRLLTSIDDNCLV